MRCWNNICNAYKYICNKICAEDDNFLYHLIYLNKWDFVSNAYRISNDLYNVRASIIVFKWKYCIESFDLYTHVI